MRVGVQAAIDSIPAQSERRDTSVGFDEAFTNRRQKAEGRRQKAERRDTALGFDEAFTLHHRAVFSMARAVVRDAALAEEVTQEVFLKLYRHLDSAPRADLLRPWLLRVTLNEARNTIRSRNRALARDSNYQRTKSQGLETQFEHESCRQLEAATRALDKIKEPMRSCLLLRHQGLSYRAIAETLSLKENYVGSLIARARKEFARTYGKIGSNR